MLERAKVYHTVKWSKSDPTKPEGMFWALDWSKNEWKLSPWLQLYDNTYKTNNKKLAFFQVAGINAMGKIYSCAFGFINNERQEGFDWLMDQVNACRESIDANPPAVTITDYDKAMKSAISRVYPDADQQLCIFHVNKNVVLNIKRKWKKDVVEQLLAAEGAPATQSAVNEEEELDGEDWAVVIRLNNLATCEGLLERLPETVEYSRAGLYKLWAHAIYVNTLDAFNLAWEKLKSLLFRPNGDHQVLEETYMTASIVKQWATCYTNQRLNFGHRTTSPVESMNRYLKSFVVNGNSTVFEAITQSLNMVKEMEVNLKEGRAQETGRLKREYLGKAWLGEAPYNVASRALKKISLQYRHMLGAIKTPERPNPAPLTPCTGQFTKQYGMPCSHELYRRHTEGELSLTNIDFHPY